MRKLSHFLLIIIFTTTSLNAQTTFGLYDGTTTTQSSSVSEDASGNIGIGIATPSSLLHINQNNYLTTSPTSDYSAITETALSGAPPTVTSTAYSKFVIKGDGKVGIGTADPQAYLHVQANKWADDDDPDMGKPIMVFSDADENLLGGFYNQATSSSDPISGTFLVFSQGNTMPAFAVVNKATHRLPMAAMGNGTVAMGIDVSNGFNVQAQVNIAENNIYNYLLKLQNADQSVDYFDVHNDGYVGIGAANSGNAALQITDGTTNVGSVAEVLIAGGSNNPRFLYIGSGTNPASANTYFSVKSTGVGVGTDDLSYGSTLAVKGNATSGTNLDIFDLSSDPQDQMSSAIHFYNAVGTLIHSISADNDALHIYPNQNATSNADKKLKVAGNEEISLNLKVGGDADITGRVKIGDVTTPCNTSGNCYSLYVEKGILAERFRCASKLSTYWSDYVFDKNYKLMSLADLEKYVNKNHHLPEIPSAKEVAKDGFDLGEMNAKLLAKVEELSLYVIDLKKENENIKTEIKKLKKQ